MHTYLKLIAIILSTFVMATACKDQQTGEVEMLYTCPMPQDSVFSDKPGKCPKCGMELVKMDKPVYMHDRNHMDSSMHMQDMDHMDSSMNMPATGYTCPMHPTVHSDTAGTCPVCGMQLEKVKPATEAKSVSLDVLIRPVNQQVVASVPMVHMTASDEEIKMELFGFINYDTRQVGVIASNINGRIEKLYVKYRYQAIRKGQKIMDIYSPGLVTAQENLLFLLKNDPGNTTLVNAAKQKLLLLGMSSKQLNQVIQSGKADYTVSVFSNYSGHIHESGMMPNAQNTSAGLMNDVALTTTELSLKEGMYLQKGQTIFSVFNPAKAWAVLNIFAGQAALVKTGNTVRIVPETAPQKAFDAVINYIEPFYRDNNKTVTARVYFDNSRLQIPVGSQVKATVYAGNKTATWLPEEAVLSLGMDNVVFVRKGEAFAARKIETGITSRHLIQVLNGLEQTEAVAANAQYLVDSESFIKTKD